MKVFQMSMVKKLLVALVVVGGAYGVVAAPALLAQKTETKADAKASAAPASAAEKPKPPAAHKKKPAAANASPAKPRT